MINYYPIWFAISWSQQYQLPNILTSTEDLTGNTIIENGKGAWMYIQSGYFECIWFMFLKCYILRYLGTA